MGVVYHANYLVWFDRARTELMRETGLTYKELEQQGVYLAVSEVHIRYLAPARYDDLIRIRCWVRELASRRVTFGYAVEHAEQGTLLATGETALLSLTHRHTLTRLPDHVRAARAGGAFAGGRPRAPRPVGPRAALGRGGAPAQEGAPGGGAGTALAKMGGAKGARAWGDLRGGGPRRGIAPPPAVSAAL